MVHKIYVTSATTPLLYVEKIVKIGPYFLDKTKQLNIE